MRTRVVAGVLLGSWAVIVFPSVFARAAHAQQAMCRETLEAWVRDKSLNARWDSGHTGVIMKRGGVEYLCTCPSQNRPPVCRPSGSSGSAGSGGSDLSRFSPAEQLALRATESVIQGLFSSIFKPPATDKKDAEAESRRLRQLSVQREEEENRRIEAQWNAFRSEQQARENSEREAARARGRELLGETGGTGVQGLAFRPVSEAPAGKYPAPASAVEQARCAAYFSEQARTLARQGKKEEAEFMSRQAQKAMAGEPLDAPCQAAATAAPDVPSPAVREILDQYNVKVRELLGISRKLNELRRQRLDAEMDLEETEARIQDLKTRAAAAAKPEEKRAADDLMKELEAAKGETENRIKISGENEKAVLEEAKRAEDEVKALDTKLQEAPVKK
ncbi:MAG: hypothetical protein ABFD80_07800 [Acidobacteriota bacterium]